MSALRRSILLLLATMTIWGSTFVVTKDLIAQVSPLSLAFLRVALGGLVLLPVAVRRYDRNVPLPWRSLIVLAFVGVAAYYVAFNQALVYTSAVQGALVQSCIPAATALVAVLWLREKASLRRWTGILLSMIGVLIVFSGGSDGQASAAMPGNLLMFLTVLAWGLYTSLAKRVAHVDPVVVTASIMGIGALMLLPAAAIETARHGGLPQLSGRGWLAVFYLGGIASGAAYMFYNSALKFMDASQAGVYTNLIPVIGVITGVMVLGEPLSLRAILGGVVAMVGVWMTSATKRLTVDSCRLTAR